MAIFSSKTKPCYDNDPNLKVKKELGKLEVELEKLKMKWEKLECYTQQTRIAVNEPRISH